MGKIKLVTTKETRFGKLINVSGTEAFVDSKGNCEVEETKVAEFLVYGFELVDKDQEFASLEKVQSMEQVAAVLEDAKVQAEAIITKAKEEAEKILKDAKAQAGKIIEDGEENKDEREEARRNLMDLTIENLKTKLKEAGVPEKDYKALNKAGLVELVVKLAFVE